MRTLILTLLILTSTLGFGQEYDDYLTDAFDNPCPSNFNFSNPLVIEQEFTDRSTLKYVKNQGVSQLQKSWVARKEKLTETVYFDTLGRIDSIVKMDGYPYSSNTIRYEYDSLGRSWYWEDVSQHEAGIIGYKRSLTYSNDGEVNKSCFWLINLPNFEDVEDIIDTISDISYDTTIGDLRRYVEVNTIHWRYYYWLQNGKLIITGTDQNYDQADYEESETGYTIKFIRTESGTITLMAIEQYDDMDQLLTREVVMNQDSQELVLVEENRYDRFQRLITHAVFCDNEEVRTYIRDIHSGAILKEIVKSNNAPTYEIDYTYH